MKIWDISVLYLGKITMPLSKLLSVSYAFGAPEVDQDFLISAPYLGFLLTCGKKIILVDTGISSKFIVDGKAWAGLDAEGGDFYVKKALEGLNISLTQIDTVIYTHLHNDHAGNCGLFKEANHVFQKDEWLNLLDPLPIQKIRKDYDQDIIHELGALRNYKVDGDLELEEGVKIYKTPGHSRGSQSVAVNTKKGTVVLVGDMLPSYITAFPETTRVNDMEGNLHSIPVSPVSFGNAIPSSITYDFYAFYDSVNKIQSIASYNKPGYIIPGHESSLLHTGI